MIEIRKSVIINTNTLFGVNNVLAFIKNIGARRQAVAMTNKQKYGELVRKAAATGKLGDGQAGELDELSAALGYDLADVETDIRAVEKYEKAKPLAAGIAAARAASARRRQEMFAHRAETEEISKSRQAEQLALDRAWRVEVDALHAGEQAQSDMERIAASHGEILGGLVESPPPIVAHIIRNRFEIGLKYSVEIDSAARSRSSEDPAGAIKIADIHKRCAAECDQLAALEKAAGNTVTFKLSAIDLDPAKSCVALDLGKYEFRPIKGQPPAEFESLISQLKAARAAVVRRAETVTA